ncbi:MAG: alpha/beta hydrolase [Candidatus Rokubacteria bacterium]|nr:alpha/beta hydrolase [Candidatus Rokubacteria bacterium]
MTDAEYVSTMKSTIVRSYKEPRLLPLVRAGNRTLGALAPGLAARLAERLFLAPPRHRRPQAEIALLASARARPMRLGDSRIETWKWGAGPRVLLVHGWGGRGGQLGAFIEPLVARGFSVVTFDAPGHGASPGVLATIPQMVAAVRAVAAQQRGPVSGLIAHSVGGVVAARALYEGLVAAAAVFLGTPADLVGPAARFTETLGFSRRVGELMRERIERRVGMPWSAFRVPELAPSLGVPLLAVHDRGDGEVPWQHSRIIARDWPGAELLTTDGLGHRRILRDPDVIGAAVAFIAARVAERRTATVAAHGAGAVRLEAATAP